MRVLLVDNYDSYTYNLFQLIAEVLGSPPEVWSNDDPALGSLGAGEFDALVISPGPGRPQKARDLGAVPQLLADPALPVLGVCLGHQAIASAAGAPVIAAPLPRHGHLSRIRHSGDALFAGIPQDFTAVRYHSLCVRQPLPAALRATAWSEDGVVMALEHRTLPRWGVQFHPESIAGEYGAALIGNFAALVQRSASVKGRRHSRPVRTTVPALDTAPAAATSTGPPRVAVLPFAVDAEQAFAKLYVDSAHAFWLDSSRTGGPARFSFLGDSSAPGGEVLSYRVGSGAVEVTPTGGATGREPGTIFDALRRRLPSRPTPVPGLPFDFTGGYVGYFGYELKADCGGRAAHRSSTPDAVWMRCDRFVAIDHVADRTYVVDVGADAGSWSDETAAVLHDLPDPVAAEPLPAPDPSDLADRIDGLLERQRDGYISDVKECLGYLASGESYEICLTTRAHLTTTDTEIATGADSRAGDLEFYRRLRAVSPAPYAALLRMGETTVFSASPERFLKVDAEGMAESRPIKGTAARHADPGVDARRAAELRTSPKTRAENLMIVDLLRNDLGRVCEVGSVDVPDFMYTESYTTVHQLVSTVRGRLRPDVTAIDAVRACFPGGSMTGAPKVRTMEILDRLEPSARGVYSGALGSLSHSGTADLSIVIRTAVRQGGSLTIGAGGAVVLDSDPAEEYAEMLVKAAVPMRAVETPEGPVGTGAL